MDGVQMEPDFFWKSLRIYNVKIGNINHSQVAYLLLCASWNILHALCQLLHNTHTVSDKQLMHLASSK